MGEVTTAGGLLGFSFGAFGLLVNGLEDEPAGCAVVEKLSLSHAGSAELLEQGREVRVGDHAPKRAGGPGRVLDQRCIAVSMYQRLVVGCDTHGGMSLRQPVSVPSPTLDKLKAVKLLRGGTYGEVIDAAVEALLASDPDLAKRVDQVLRAAA